MAIDDVGNERHRWPGYCDVLERHDLRAVLGLPLVINDERIGALDVYDRSTRSWSETEVSAAGVLADVATAYVANAGELARTRRTAEQLQHALDSRVVIEQAKGKLSESTSLSMDEAFELMRNHARSTGQTVRSVARQVIDQGVDVVRWPPLRERRRAAVRCPGPAGEARRRAPRPPWRPVRRRVRP